MTKKSYEKKEGDAMNALNRFVLFSFIGASFLSLESGTVERRVTIPLYHENKEMKIDNIFD